MRENLNIRIQVCMRTCDVRIVFANFFSSFAHSWQQLVFGVAYAPFTQYYDSLRIVTVLSFSMWSGKPVLYHSLETFSQQIFFFSIGIDYLEGHGIDGRDFELAFYWMLKATQHDCSASQLHLGLFFWLGIGINKVCNGGTTC